MAAATLHGAQCDSARVSGSEGFDKELTQDIKDGQPNSIAVVELKENEYLLPTAILCEHSPVIKDAVCAQKGNSIPRIHIKGIDDNTFHVLVEFMRGNTAPVTVQNVVDVYHAACSLRMKPLETVCWNKVFEKEPVERSLPAWIAAKRLNMPDEEKQLYRYITYNFDEVVKTDSFLELDASQLKELLRADVIKAEDELSLYKALMLWIHHDCKARHKYASSLVEAIRFQDMTPAQVEGFKAFKVCPEVQKSFDVSNRIPQPGQQKTDKARQYAQAQKMGAPTDYSRPATAETVATPATLTSVPRPMGVAASTLGTAVPPFQAPEQVRADTAASLQAPPPPPPPQKKSSEPVVLSLEQQQAVLPTLKPEEPKREETLDKKGEKDQRKDIGSALEKKVEKKETPKEPMPVQEPMLTTKDLIKTEEGKKHETHKKGDSLDRPDSRGDKKSGKKHGLKDGAGEKQKEADALKSVTSDPATATTLPPNMSEPTSATTVPPSTVESAPSKPKSSKETKDKRHKGKKEAGGKEKKSKGKSGKPAKKKKSFCPWLGSKKSSKPSKQSSPNKQKGKNKSKESASKDAAGRSEGNLLESGIPSKPKDKRSPSKEDSTKSRSKEGKNKGSKEKAAKGSKEKAGSKEGVSKQKHSKEKHGSKEKRGDKDKHRSKEKSSKEKHSKDKHSKEKISKEKSSSKEGKKKDKSKKHSGSKSESREAGGGGGAKKRETRAPSKRKDKASADVPGGESSGGGGGKTRKAKHSTSKSRKSESSSRRSHSSSSRARSSGRSSATVPKRRPEKEKGRSDLALTTKKSDSGGGRAHRRTRSANRLSSAAGGSELSLVGGKSAFQTERDKRRRRLSNVPHRARSDAMHASDLSVRGLEQNPADPLQMVVAVLGGLTVDSKGTTPENAAIYSFWPSDKMWKTTGKMPKPRYGHQAVIGTEHIYVVGGFEVPDNDERVRPTAVCHRFSLTRQRWEPMASLGRARCHHGVALLLGKVYAVGGQSTDGVFLDSVEVYDPDADRWTEATPLCCARIAANAVGFRDRMYVVGGLMVVPGHKRRVCVVPDTVCFEPKTDTWHHKGALPLAMCNCSLVVHAGRLLAVGGLVRRPGASATSRQQPLTPINGLLEYSPASDSWAQLSTLPAPLHSVCVASLGEEIYVLGGQLADDAATAVNAAYRYNPVTDRWTSLPPLPVRLSQACALTVRQHVLSGR